MLGAARIVRSCLEMIVLIFGQGCDWRSENGTGRALKFSRRAEDLQTRNWDGALRQGDDQLPGDVTVPSAGTGHVLG